MVILFLAGSSQAVYADVVLDPENKFFNKYFAYMIPLEREFIANGEAGYVTAMEEPGSKFEIVTLENGESCYITYTCLYEGEYWGISYVWTEERSGYGWLKMDELLVLYDQLAFEEEHETGFYDFDGELDEIISTGSVVIWDWPGSGNVNFTYEIFESDRLWVYTAWKDGDGREWGRLNFYGRYAWICISDPMNYDLPLMDPMPAPATWVSETTHAEISTAKVNSSPVVLIMIIVAALVAGTVLLIKLLYNPKKKLA